MLTPFKGKSVVKNVLGASGRKNLVRKGCPSPHLFSGEVDCGEEPPGMSGSIFSHLRTAIHDQARQTHRLSYSFHVLASWIA